MLTPDAPLDESCYRESQNSDIYVLIIGGRYGSEISATKTEVSKSFFDRYESITKQEYKSAVDKDIPVYILIEKSVYSEYQTFLSNRDNENIRYAHVDSVNIFHFIEEILAQSRNNPVHTFDRHAEIEAWLREQWAGLFRELIQRMSSQRQLASLSSQVLELAEINKTLKRYLEQLLVSQVAPEKSEQLISDESKRLEQARRRAIFRDNRMLDSLARGFLLGTDFILNTLAESSTLKEFLDKTIEYPDLSENEKDLLREWQDNTIMQIHFANAKEALKANEPRSDEEEESNRLQESSTKKSKVPKKT